MQQSGFTFIEVIIASAMSITFGMVILNGITLAIQQQYRQHSYVMQVQNLLDHHRMLQQCAQLQTPALYCRSMGTAPLVDDTYSLPEQWLSKRP